MAKRTRKPKAAPAPPMRLAEQQRAGAVPVRVLRAKYDAAATTTDNFRHWANADALSPDAAVSAVVRQALRNRCRYEYANNSYCKGIVDTLATDCVGGTGPRLQMLIDGRDDLNDEIEQDFAEWAEEVGLPEILRTARAARAHSGETFGLIGTNLNLVSPVKLSVQLVEAEQVAQPFDAEPTLADGIEYDQFGNPTVYSVLREHPGGSGMFGFFGAELFDRWPAKFVLHYYRPDRPGQHRGVPDLTPAVQLFADLRRYSTAVLRKAETAAELAAFLHTDAAPDGEAVPLAPMETFDLEFNMGVQLPAGWNITQLKAEEPTTVYGDFVDKKLEEIARCLGIPWTIAALNSSKANMSASYLDGQRYSNSVSVDRHRLECLLNKLLDAWLTEWVKVRQVADVPARFPHQWFWPSMGHHADPGKVAAARTEALKNGTTTIPLECAKEGRDWEKDQTAAAAALGKTVDEYRELLVLGIFGPPPAAPAAPADGETDDADETEPANNGRMQ